MAAIFAATPLPAMRLSDAVFKYGIGTETRKGNQLKETLFAFAVLIVHVGVGGLIIFAITYFSDRVNPKPDVPANYTLNTNRGL
jgi:hypothetical protein